MMQAICIAPTAFKIPPNCGAESFCGCVLSFLRDAEENCVVLVDSNTPSSTSTELMKILDSWPHKYRVKAKCLLARLRQRKRFVSATGYASASSCEESTCKYAIGIAQQNQPDAILVKDECLAEIRSLLNQTQIITPKNYQISQFSDLRRDSRRVRVPCGTISQLSAESKIFGPVLRYATHVTIIDRYIGRSVPSEGTGISALSTDYQQSLQWLCEMYQKSVAQRGIKSIATFEIWCGLQSKKLSTTAIDAAVAALRGWESKMKAQGIPGFTLHIKKECNDSEFPHARYLITDQLALLVERGFELLRSMVPNGSTRSLRDCEIALIPDLERVVTDVRRLESL